MWTAGKVVQPSRRPSLVLPPSVYSQQLQTDMRGPRPGEEALAVREIEGGRDSVHCRGSSGGWGAVPRWRPQDLGAGGHGAQGEGPLTQAFCFARGPCLFTEHSELSVCASSPDS